MRPDPGAQISSDIKVEPYSFYLDGDNGILALRQRLDVDGSLDLEGTLQASIAAGGTVARLQLTGDVTLGPESELRLIKVDAAPFGPQTDYIGVIGTLGSIAGQFSSITVFERDCSAGCVDREIPGVTAVAT